MAMMPAMPTALCCESSITVRTMAASTAMPSSTCGVFAGVTKVAVTSRDTSTATKKSDRVVFACLSVDPMRDI